MGYISIRLICHSVHAFCQIVPDGSYLVYSEWASKCNPGGITNVNKKGKRVKVFASSNASRCPVAIMKKYLTMT